MENGLEMINEIWKKIRSWDWLLDGNLLTELEENKFQEFLKLKDEIEELPLKVRRIGIYEEREELMLVWYEKSIRICMKFPNLCTEILSDKEIKFARNLNSDGWIDIVDTEEVLNFLTEETDVFSEIQFKNVPFMIRKYKKATNELKDFYSNKYFFKLFKKKIEKRMKKIELAMFTIVKEFGPEVLVDYSKIIEDVRKRFVKNIDIFEVSRIFENLRDFGELRWKIGDILIKMEDARERMKRTFKDLKAIEEINDWILKLKEKYPNPGEELDEGDGNMLSFDSLRWKNELLRKLEWQWK